MSEQSMMSLAATGGPVTGIVPKNLDDVWRIAGAIVESDLAPKDLDTREKVTVAIMHGMEVGLPPMMSVQKIAVIHGRPSIWGDAIPALLLSRGFKLHERMDGEGDERTANCRVTRPDGSEIERSFSVIDARKAGLWNKKGPWQDYPDRMLQMRARGFAARDGAADVLGGMYLREELEALPMKDVTPAQPDLGIPDIPDVLDAEIIDDSPPLEETQDTSEEGLLRDLERAVEGALINEILQVEQEYKTAILNMSEAGRERAIEIIEAAKAFHSEAA